MNIVPKRSFYLDNIFDDFFVTPRETDNIKCDVYLKDNNYYIEADVPGFDRNDITIECDNGYLTIKASKEKKEDVEEKNYIKRERIYGSYQRQFYLGDINPEMINAEFKDGLLRIIVPKMEEKETKTIVEIK